MLEFRLPSLGADMDEGTLVEWQIRPGDTVTKGQVVAVVETAYTHPTSFLFVEYEENIGYKDSYVLHQTQ